MLADLLMGDYSIIMSIKERQRVADFGEVFTSEREVNAMLDLVYNETQRIDSRFLEPACGDGNFLVEVLRRKLDVVRQKYRANQLDFERYTFQAVGSIYGVDILADNVEECRERLFVMVSDVYKRIFKDRVKPQFNESIKFVLSRNILWGDALTLKEPDSDEPIIFSEWSFTTGSIVKRADYTLHTLLAYQPMEGETLFSDLGDQAFIPKPIKEFIPVHLFEVHDAS